MSDLPDGWTIERLQVVSMGTAEVLPSGTAARLDGATRTVPLSPTAIISFSGLCLVRDADDGIWYMGERDTDGTIVCWAGYGGDLEEAIKGL
jgi:hypothetical protein